MKNLLLISNSTNPGEPYLGWTKQYLKQFFEKHQIPGALFIPYAGVNLTSEGIEKSFDVYEQKVKAVFAEMNIPIYSIHKYPDLKAAIKNADSIVVGGGNTFYLVYMLQKLKLMETIQMRVRQGLPYIGWSAGANIACPSMKTTNDMPIIEPESFHCLNLVPFQINPHYLDKNPEGHGGETRQQRIEEYLTVNKNMTVIGLREATLLEITKNTIELKGDKPLVLFKHGEAPVEFAPFMNINFLIQE